MDYTPEKQTITQDRLLDLGIFEKQDSIEIPYHYHDRRGFFSTLNTEKSILYMAKTIKNDFESFSKEDLIDLHREINIRSKLLHPAIIKFIGYSLTDFEKKDRPVIITEYASKNNLNNILLKDDNKNKLNLTDTQKLINIYGIAAGMFYLHLHDIILRNLHLESIFLDERLYPKIAEFSTSKEIASNSSFSEPRTDTIIKTFSTTNLAPEILTDVKYSKLSDVYDFGNLCYSIMMNKEPDDKKITFESTVPEVYQNLIKKCWSKDPENRPSFSEILQELKTDSNYITESIDKDEFYNYIKSIEESQVEFNNEICNQKLDEKINEFMHTFHRNDVNIKLRGPLNSDLLINLNNYEKTESRDEYLSYETYEVCEKESGLNFCGFSYLKEIMTFSKHEIINFCREMNIISKLNHPSILKMIGYSPVNFNNDPYPTIISEFALWKNLKNIIASYDDDQWDDTHKLIMIYGIAAGMAYLHSHDIIHRDLKPKNIYVDDNYLPKIAGFNISKEIKSEEDKKSNNIKGTPIYLAPEIYQNKEYSKSSDVYAYSMILYEIFTEKRPYSEYTSAKEIKEKVSEEGERPKFSKAIPAIYRQLIERCWSQNPSDRPTFEEIVHELRTNPEFITDSTDKEDYFEYIQFIDEFNITFEPSRQVKELNDILTNKIDTFKEVQPSLDIRKMNETETNGLTFNDDLIDYTKYSTDCSNHYQKHCFYKLKVVEEGKKDFAKKKFSYKPEEIFKNGIINFRREMSIMPQLNHPAILKFIGYNPNGSNRNNKTPVIITEYADENDLAQNLYEYNDLFTNTHKLIIIYGIAAGMAYLHSHDIIHRDLKLENIYLNKKYYPKIAGFNISKEIKSEEDKKSNSIKGTPIYLAPEIYQNKEYSKSSDVYAYSMILYEIFTEKRPYSEYTSAIEIKEKVSEEGERPKFSKGIPAIYRQLIERCWSQNPSDRPTFEEIVHELRTNPEYHKILIEEVDTEKVEEEEEEAKDDDDEKVEEEEEVKDDDDEKVEEEEEVKDDEKEENDDEKEEEDNNDEKGEEEEKGDDSIDDDDEDGELAFQRYVKYIDESEITFDPSKKIQPYENFASVDAFQEFLSFYNKINIRPVYKTEMNNVLFGYDFVNLNDYEVQGPTIVNSNNKINTIVNKETGLVYRAKRYRYSIDLREGQNLINLLSEIHINYEINHPSFLKYIGYSPVNFKNKMKPVIITESASHENRTLYKILETNKSDEEEEDNNKSILTDTNKLIIIYGIAAGLQYLHSLGIIHGDFDASEILLDKSLYPKIRELVSPIYMSKVHLYKSFDSDYNSYSTASDVYSFAITTYGIIANEEVYSLDDFCINDNAVFSFKKTIQNCYRNLIEKCISEDPIDRPTFEEIVHHLKTNNEFITDKIDKEKFDNYIKYIESNQKEKQLKSSSSDDLFFRFNDYIKTGKFTFRRINLDRKSLGKKFSINMGAFDLSLLNKKQKICSYSFYNIYKVMNKKDQSECAAKVLIFEIGQCSDSIIENIINEINILSQLNHSSIIKYIGFSPKNFNNKRKPVILTEIASNGSLQHIFEINRKGICDHSNWNDTKKLINIYGIASAMKYLHENGILHRNLNPESILLDAFLYPKIADFSFAKEIKNIEESEALVGSYLYCAPEILKENKYTTASDVYSFGLVMHEIMTNEFPFNYSNTFEKQSIEIKCKLPTCYENLIKKCLNDSIDSRPSFDDIINELENNKDFITSNVSKDEYLNYISYVKSGSKNPNYSNSIINLQTNELDDDNGNKFLDLSNYEKKETIGEFNSSKVNKIIEKNSNKVYMCHHSMNKITKVEGEEDISKLNHPSILKFIGCSQFDFKRNRNFMKITEYASNGSLYDILRIERMNNIIKGWDDTKKMMNIYGIASGMSYYHSHEILHRCLNPSTIYLDDILLPKIDLNPQSSNSGFHEYFIYLAPEVLQHNSYSKSSDVYSFALVIYEILVGEKPFIEINNFNQLLTKVVLNGDRPKLNDSIPLELKDLISKCWHQDPNERPTFDEITICLQNISEFDSIKVDKEDYQKYVNYIDNKDISILNENEKDSFDEAKSKKESLNSENIDELEFLFRKYSNENDAENIYKYACMLIKAGNCNLPLEYAVNIYKSKHYKQAFMYFSLMAEVNHPIAKYYIGVMKFFGFGCSENKEEAYQILKTLSDNGIERATEFLEEHF